VRGESLGTRLIFAYVKDGKYPADYTKDEKRALRKQAKFFVARGT